MKTFFEKHIWPIKGKLYRLTYLWVKDREVAQDILQTVFEKTLRNEANISKLKNPVGWVVVSLKNESLQHHQGIADAFWYTGKFYPPQHVRKFYL